MINFELRKVISALGLLLFLAFTACQSRNELAAGGVGDSCSSDGQCRLGLVCGDQMTCELAGNLEQGDTCQLSGSCLDSLYCAADRTCQPAGTAAVGEACNPLQGAADCEKGLVCALEGFGAKCVQAGDTDLGGACTALSDCLAGLSCLEQDGSKVCTSPPPPQAGQPALPPFPVWPGADCPADESEAVAYFEVPRGSGDNDFYRLPYPNDIRKDSEGNIDPSGHPTPGDILGTDLVQLYIDASKRDLQGFSTNATAFFRFSTGFQTSNLPSQSSPSDVLRIVNLDTGEVSTSLRWFGASGRFSKYICENWLSFGPAVGDTLEPGTPYAFIISKDLMAEGGGAFARDADLDALLADTSPGGDLADAYTAYQPLRDWLDDPTNTEVAEGDILSVAVFTTQDPEATIKNLEQVIDDLPDTDPNFPAVVAGKEFASCDGADASNNDSPVCGSDIKCTVTDGSDAVQELHGIIELPAFQEGTLPFETSGGNIALDGSDMPEIQGRQEVCVTLTVPRDQDPPADGFPLVIYAHGTGGSATSSIENGIARDIVTGELDSAPVNAVVLGFDLPMHGSRKGGSTRGSDELFFNAFNPAAARDNLLQGSADIMALLRWASDINIASGDSPTGREIAFDADALMLFAHSQGASHAALLLPYEDSIHAAVLSGVGGDLRETLLNKTMPTNFAAALPLVLSDPDPQDTTMLAAGINHPVLNIIQPYFDRSDPVNMAPRIFFDRGDQIHDAAHLFLTYGVADSFTPEENTQALIRSAGLAGVNPIRSGGFAGINAPVSENVLGGTLTAAFRQYDAPAGQDGHFVVFAAGTDGGGRDDALKFIFTAILESAPTIGE